MGKELQRFTPLKSEEVSLYTCGPTVYNYAHIGNLRTYICEDILHRTLEFAGYKVKHVMNITDVGHLTEDTDDGEDKMVKSAREKKQTVWEIADFYTKAFFRDCTGVNIKRPDICCKATDHIADMIALIRRIEANGYAYFTGGNVYFDIMKFRDYGKLAALNLEDLKAGSRIAVDQNKKNPLDFVLWFTKSKFENQEMVWDSPWGRGYPGWHIECSAMSMKYLGEEIDIHCGGIDHISVHHTNEIAQSEAATGKKWVNYWLHNEFIVTTKEKMAKSSGNFLTLEQLTETGYDPLDYRYFCLQAHYRAQLQFSYEALDAARNSRHNLMERIGQLKQTAGNWQETLVTGKAAEYLETFKSDAASDLNMPRCLSDLWNLLKDNAVTDKEKLVVVSEMDKILGLKLETAQINTEIDEDSLQLIAEREEARKNKKWARSDEIRELLKVRGITVEDTPQGMRWKKN